MRKRKIELVWKLGCLVLGVHSAFFLISLIPAQADWAIASAFPPSSTMTPRSHPLPSHPTSFSLTCLSDPPSRMDAEALTCADADNDAMGQVRSVAELSDVHPTDWAFQALQTLVDRYGILTGYPDGTFRGNRPLSRDEFAAVLQAALERIEQLYQVSQDRRIREDFITLQRLQKNYASIRDELDTRLNDLDGQIGGLEKRQFSTTTKLSGQVVGIATGGTRARLTGVERFRLNLNTSFSGNDLLVTQLESGNNGGDAVSRVQNRRQNLLGTTGLLAGGGGLDYVEVPAPAQISKLYYTFQPLQDLNLTIGSRLPPRDFIDNNRFANSSDTNFSSSFFMNNPLIVQNQVDRPGGAGVALVWEKENFPLALRALYVAADADRPNFALTKGGVFGDRYQGSLELEYAFNKALTTRLQFTRAKINNTDIYAGGINAEWAINQQFAVFGRYGIGTYMGFNPVLNRNLDLTPQTWAIGAILRNIVIPGSTAGLALGQPFIADGLGNATQTNVETFYSFLINDNISFTPVLMLVTSPNNNRSSGTIWEFALRMVFSF
ncbi:iron uptake porin [Kovacikia minuta CCNUW1]|uniref:iron uptake porin n=1 Tax=Kovacikia minuta TaxID=2931930 RepID=UPI001CC9404B|nr:iron uptake porin [Kovacikia minuta]UBF24504.1 iron uptake porin [Kovacikia minuta CCNUW1]